MKWELAEEQPSAMGAGYDCSPVQYPRSGDARSLSVENKGAASVADNINAAVALDSTGNVNVPRHTQDVNYKVGPYPVVEELDVDEGDGASR